MPYPGSHDQATRLEGGRNVRLPKEMARRHHSGAATRGRAVTRMTTNGGPLPITEYATRPAGVSANRTTCLIRRHSPAGQHRAPSWLAQSTSR